MPGLSFLIIAVVASAAVFGPICSWLALQRGRSWVAWFLFGVALGPLAAGLLLVAPPGRCPTCGTTVRGWPDRCEGCGLVFGTGDPGHATSRSAGRREAAGLIDGIEGHSTGLGTERAGPPVTGHVGGGGPLEPGRRSATVLGRRPVSLRNAPPAATRRSPNVAILGSGIFMGGTAPLQIGSRYFLARVGPELQALGPMHASPSTVAARIMLADTESTVVADRLLITGRNGGRGPTLAFSALAIEPEVDLAEQLRVRGRRKATTS